MAVDKSAPEEVNADVLVAAPGQTDRGGTTPMAKQRGLQAPTGNMSPGDSPEGVYMHKRMVVLLDGSEMAEVVFGYAQAVAGRLGLDLELLHIASPNEAAQLPMKRAYMDRMAEVLCAGAEEMRTQGEGAASGRCIEAKGTIVFGDASEEILKYLGENDVDLVMMATRGSSGINKEWDLGSVAHKVVHAANVPIWLVPGELREEVVLNTLPKRLLVIPLSGAELSEAVMPHALAMARQFGSNNELVLVWVDQEMALGSPGQVRERSRMTNYLNGVAESIRKAGVDARVEILEGTPAESIIEFVKKNPTQLLAMATHGHLGLNRLVFGSVTENVIHMIKVTPMLLVPAMG